MEEDKPRFSLLLLYIYAHTHCGTDDDDDDDDDVYSNSLLDIQKCTRFMNGLLHPFTNMTESHDALCAGVVYGKL